MATTSPFHAGELAVQARAGVAHSARMNGAALRSQIPAGAVPFLAQQPMVIVASISQDDSVWASVLLGNPGFLQAEGVQGVSFDVNPPRSAPDDPLWRNLQDNSHIGLLVIELGSRRRLRVNGRARTTAAGRVSIDVESAYPNCPKYIQRRQFKLPVQAESEGPIASRHGSLLTADHRDWILRADTLFVASAHPGQGADASHRGGRPGFVQIPHPQTLRIPDYPGNNMFNTLGNFENYPHAGLAFVDFEQGRLLQLTGRPVIRWDISDPDGRSGGSGRFWDFEVEAWRESALALRLEWEFLDYSTFLPPQKHAAGDLVLQVAEIHQETDRIKRFRLRAFDDAALPAFAPGAHLPVTLEIETGERVQRHYSILSAPDERGYYDIAVLYKTRGRGGSRHLHESIRAGDQLMSGQPRNEFPLADMAEHSILIAGGIGITPILSLLRSLQERGQSCELHYSARRRSGLAFRKEIEDLVGDRARFYTSQEPDGGRIDLEAILERPNEGVHVYVCGPRRLIGAVRDVAADNGWPTEQIHFENFGAAPTAEDRAITVTLARSGTVLTVPATQSILDTLLDADLAVPHDCKRGECSLCATPVLEGNPEHRDLCLDKNERKEFMCVCVSRALTDHLTLDL